MYTLLPIDASLRAEVTAFIARQWGSPIMVSRGRVHSADRLPGYAAMSGDQIAGLVTYLVEGGACEIVSLDSLEENRGIGTMLVEAVVRAAMERRCRKVWLVTTNDNTRAIRFYQKRGFRMKALHLDAVKEARKIKPQIPLFGYDGIPIEHEIEFERQL